MKKIIAILLIFSFAVLCACGRNGVTQEEYNTVSSEKDEYKEKYDLVCAERDEYKRKYESAILEIEKITEKGTEEKIIKQQEKPKYNTEELLEMIDLTKYSWANETNMVVITNNSDVVLRVGVNITAKNADGKVLNTSSQKTPSIEPGGTGWFQYSESNGEMGSVDFDFDVKEVLNYDSVLNYIEYKITETDNGISIDCKNISDTVLRNVSCHVLFLKGDNVVAPAYINFKDYDFELKPGETITQNCNTPTNSLYDKYLYNFYGNKK